MPQTEPRYTRAQLMEMEEDARRPTSLGEIPLFGAGTILSLVAQLREAMELMATPVPTISRLSHSERLVCEECRQMSDTHGTSNELQHLPTCSVNRRRAMLAAFNEGESHVE